MILFIAANPLGTDRLALDQEARSVLAELKRSGYRDRFDFQTRWAAEPLDLLREVRDLKPTIVHFSGHGHGGGAAASGDDGDPGAGPEAAGVEPHGLYFQDAAGGAQVVSSEAIAQMLGAAGTSTKLVVLNACFTEPIADALLAHVDYVVGMAGSIPDEAARSFAIGFYGGLAAHASIALAFAHGKAAVALEGLADAELPRLKVRNGLDATQVVLAASAPVVREELRCPYPGMRAYTADDAAGFYGRETEVNDLLGRLRAGDRDIYVIGPSGSGKSSLISAGVLPRLARGVAGLGPFVVRDVRPGEHPATHLRQALGCPPGSSFVAADRIAALLAHRGAGALVLIVVDQLEELFTLASADEREQFLAAVRALRAERRCVVIFALRADFYGALMESPLWTEHRGQLSRIDVSPLVGGALREAILAPARNLGVAVEPELTERLLADAASEPGILPLLQETMVQLWDERGDQTLRITDYRALGDGDRSGLAVALARRADATLRRFTPVQANIARRILLRLISFGEGRSDTRRQQAYSKLRTVADDAAGFTYVLQQMIDDRLLTIDRGDDRGEPRVDLGHEVMIASWPALAGWIRTHRVDEQRRRELEAAAAQWLNHGSSARGLLDPIELAEAEAWQRTESALQLGHNAEIMALIAASRTAHTTQRRHRRGLLCGAFAALTVGAIIVTVLAIGARDQADNARQQADRARDEAGNARREARNAQESDRRNQQLLAQSYMESGRQLLLAGQPEEATPYLVEARKYGEAGRPLRMMFWAVARRLPLARLPDPQAGLVRATVSPDGKLIVTANDVGEAKIWDPATGPYGGTLLQHKAGVMSAVFSPDSHRVATASKDKTAQVWDAVTGQRIGPALQHQAGVTSAMFSPDGRRVVTSSEDRTARIWDAATGQPLSHPLAHPHPVRSAMFNPDGTHVATASDRSLRIWDAATGVLLTTRPLDHAAAVDSMAYRRDGMRIVTASGHAAQIWDAAIGERSPSVFEHRAEVVSVAFSPDGASLLTASLDGTARVWDVMTGKPITGPLEHQAAVLSAAFSPDGTRVVTASEDKTARVWSASTGKALTRPLEHLRPVRTATFSPGGIHVITASEDNATRVWDVAAQTPTAEPLEHQAPVSHAAFSLEGTRIITVSEDHTARVWDVATGRPQSRPLAHPAKIESVAFSADGTRVVTVSKPRTVHIWDVATGHARIATLKHQVEMVRAVLSSDGTRVVTVGDDKTARVWETSTGAPLTPVLEHPSAVLTAAFSPDGTRVVTTSGDTAMVWTVATENPLPTILKLDSAVRSATFSPDGTRIVTASADHFARVWDAATGQPMPTRLEHHAEVSSAAFSPDGTRVLTTSEDHIATIWDPTNNSPTRRLRGHEGLVRSAVFSPDCTRVVTASDDKTARVWDAATGKQLAADLVHRGAVRSALFSPSSADIVTASEDHTARIWDARIHEGTVEQWNVIATRSRFMFDHGELAVPERF